MLKTIAKPFGWLMLWLYNTTGNYGVAVIMFALIVNLILLPFMWKSKKSMMRTTRLQPRITELQKKHEGNQQKLNEEMSKLYREENVHPMSGCLWSLIPFPILIALYQAIRMPITVMMGVGSELMEAGGAIYEKLAELGYSIANYTTGSNTSYEQIYQSKFITEHFADFAPISDKLQPIRYDFLGLDLSVMPNFKIWDFDFSSPAVWLPAVGLFLIPFISAFMSWLAMFITSKTNPSAVGMTAQQQATNKSMPLMMPLMSVWFCFIMPSALGVYWIINSAIGVVRDVTLTKVFTKRMDREDAARLELQQARQSELESKRQETERLRAANATNQNKNTSKKKMQATLKQKDDERRASAEKAERAERRARLGITEPEKPSSQVGNRRYAKGRAYVEDRYSNPEDAEEATLAAAAESEFGVSIDMESEKISVADEKTAEADFPEAGDEFLDGLSEEPEEPEFEDEEDETDGSEPL